MVPFAFNTWFIFQIFILAGVSAFSLYVKLHLSRNKKKLNHMMKTLKDLQFFAKEVELEHNAYLNILYILFWSMMIFFTGGIVSMLIHPLEELPIVMRYRLASNILLLGVWYLLGIWFGVISPLYGYIVFLRELLIKVASRK